MLFLILILQILALFDETNASHLRSSKFETSCNCYFVYSKNDSQGIIDKHGKFITQPLYSEISFLSEGYFVACRKQNENLLCGFVDTLGNEIEFIYDYCYPFNSGYAAVKVQGKWTFVNKEFQPILPPRFELVINFKDGFARVKENGLWGFIDSTGSLMSEINYSWASSFYYHHAFYLRDGKYGFINSKGEEIVKPRYEQVREFSSVGIGYGKTSEGVWEIIDTSGKVLDIFPENICFDRPPIQLDRFLRIKTCNNEELKYGYMDLTGEIIIPPIYESITPFLNSNVTVAELKNNDNNIQFGVIDSAGRHRTSFIYDYIDGFTIEVGAIVKKKIGNEELKILRLELGDEFLEFYDLVGLQGRMNPEGAITIPVIYTNLHPLRSHWYDDYFKQCLFVATKPGFEFAGVLDDYNNVVVPFNYNFSNVIYLKDGVFYVERNGNQFLFDSKVQREIPFNNLAYHREYIKACDRGLLIVKDTVTNLYGLSDLELRPLINPFFDYLTLFTQKDYRHKE